MREVKFATVLKQYKIYHIVDDSTEYRQVTISKHRGVSFRGSKYGHEIGRKRQFVIDLEEYPNTFIFTRQGVQDGSYGMVPQDVHNCVVTENMPMFAVQATLNPVYLEFYLQTRHFQDQLQALNAAGSAQKSIHEKTLLQLDILLPDIGVQNTIVEEIESVKMKQGKVLTELKTQSNLITKLRSSILSDAVSGRLVSQDPNDETASMLLERIKAEKERLIKEGKLKRDKPLAPITADEIPYELPEGWSWVTLLDLFMVLGGATPNKATPKYWEGTIPWVSPKDMKVSYISDAQDHVSESAFTETRLPLIPKNSLLVVVRGMILLHSFPIALTSLPVAINQDMKAFVPFIKDILPYLMIALKGHKNELLNLVTHSTHGTCKLESYKLFSFKFGLPPLAEQHRIVAKVEQLIATCDALEAEVAKSRMETDRLMQTILKEAFGKRNEIDV